MNEIKKSVVSPASLDLMISLVRDSGNWSGTPMLDISKAQRGNLTQLKQAGLLSTFENDNLDWVSFKFSSGDLISDGSRTFRLGNFSDYHSIEAI